MSVQYSDVPLAGVMQVSPSIPSGMLYRVKQKWVCQNKFKNSPFIRPNHSNQRPKIIVSLPPNSLVDLSTFEMNFTGATQHRGNNASTSVANYVPKAYFPRNGVFESRAVFTLNYPNYGSFMSKVQALKKGGTRDSIYQLNL
jgi:hypothetical protein